MQQNPFDHITFTDSNGEVVIYDGSPVTWRVSAYAIIIEDEKILLIKSKADHLYDVVGGGIELGETIEAALAREAREEAGVSLEIGELCASHQDFFYHRGEEKFYQTLLLFYKAKRTSELGQQSDAKIIFRQFVELSELSDYPMLEYLRKIIFQSTHKP
jgi:8-oxo-dGTP pyrophosphatase MutT (NUDIX family)